ncbi:MBL fold metallo-hydrolase [Erysipelotrichaceae bacterium RD49]|nr:MBL fold metallo-hydrolase [Erysipelotrichaceae bacterium RD49]
MYELHQVSDHCYFIQSPAKIGLVQINDKEVILIDSGNDQEAGRKVRKLLDAKGWTLKAIYNTHSNADHIGGNKYLHTQTNCDIYAPGIEQAFTAFPLLEPSFLYGGYPPKELRHKFLMAKPSPAKLLSQKSLPEQLELIPLPGHFFDMVGFKTDEQIIYLADCLSSKETLAKYQIGFIYDVAAYLDTLEKVKTLKAKLFIPAHAAPTDNIEELAQYNIDQVNKIADHIVELCQTPKTFETLLGQLFTDYDLIMNFEQYALVGSTVRSYLSWLQACGRIQAAFENNQLLYRTI